MNPRAPYKGTRPSITSHRVVVSVSSLYVSLRTGLREQKSTLVTCCSEAPVRHSVRRLSEKAKNRLGELFKRCRGIFRSLGWPVAARTESALRIELENGSRIVALPGSESTVRGYSAVRLLVLDEAARIPPELITATSRCWQSLEAA